jgi:hypothetical protein
MTTNRKIFAVAIITIVLTGALALFTRRPDGSKVFNRYIACRPPDSFKISEFERHGFREWDALFHFQISPVDFSNLLQCNSPKLLDIHDLDSVGFASLALQVLKHHSPTTDFARDYEIYSFSPANAITDNYLVIGKKHSEGYIVVLRYP